MKRSVIALAAIASLVAIEGWDAPVAHAAADSWTVTAAEVAVADVPNEKAAPRYAVQATATLGDALLGQAVYTEEDFADEAACKAALDKGPVKDANDALTARILGRLPDAKVKFECVPAE